MQNKDIVLFFIRAKSAIEWSSVDAKTKVLLLTLMQEIAALAEKVQKTN